MSDPLTPNEGEEGSNSNKIEPSGEESSNILVQLSNKTLALLNQDKDDSSDYEPKTTETSYWNNLSKFIFNVQRDSENLNDTKPNKRSQPRRRKSKPMDNAPGLSENQLSAPYIEE